jgi:hypothetical protein
MFNVCFLPFQREVFACQPTGGSVSSNKFLASGFQLRASGSKHIGILRYFSISYWIIDFA